MALLALRGALRLLMTILLVYTQSIMLPMRRRRVFLVCGVCALAVNGCISPYATASMTTAMMAVVYLLPLLFYTGRLRIRLLGATMSVMPMFCGEMLGSALQIIMGQPLGDLDLVLREPVPYFTALVLDIAFVFFGGRYLARLLKGALDAGDMAAVEKLVWLIPLEAVALFALASLGFEFLPASRAFYLALVAVALLGIGACLFQIRLLRRSLAAVRERERARAMERQLDCYLKGYGEVLDGMRRISRLRHDARNHAAVLAGLIDRGEFEAARSYAQACSRAFACGDSGDGGEGR